MYRRLLLLFRLVLTVGLVLFMIVGCDGSPAENEIQTEESDHDPFSAPTLPETSQVMIEVSEKPEESSREREKTQFKQDDGIFEVLQSDEPSTATEPDDADFVRVKDYIPDIEVMLMYATDQNFTGEVIYSFTDAYLRYGTVKKLATAQEALKKQGYRIMLWDAFRPVSAQFLLWDVCPDPRYVANPLTGYSSHSRGNTIDLTIVTLAGGEVEMPTGFDDFSYLADRDYDDCTELAASHASMLEDIMMEAGFEPYSGEWWHFSDYDNYPVEEEFEPPASSH